MKAIKKNITDVLGIHAEGVKLTKTRLGNGYQLRGFLSRYALMDLMNNFHVYISKKNDVVVITPGRLSVKGRV